MSSSSYYKKKINKYQNIKSKLKETLEYFDDCFTNMNDSASHLENVILENEPFDKGKIREEINNLSKINQNLKSVINECNYKIDKYTKLYKKALAEERKASNSN